MDEAIQTMTLREAASVLRISYWQAALLARDGSLPVFRPGKRAYRITAADLAAYIEQRRCHLKTESKK